VLETPQLPAQIRALPAPLLGKLIEHVGLEDAAELVALASTEQLAGIFDEDLWHSERAGEDERFDAERFVLWLEILLEAGERVVAERLAELPQELVTLAFQRRLLVVPLDDLQAELSAGDDEAEAAEKALASCLSEELDEYQLIWRGGDGFDAVLAALLALDRDHHSLVADILERCAALSSEVIADNGGLYEVLSSEEMLEQDLAAERETRRAERGYVAPSAAAAFLRLARSAQNDETPFTAHDPLTRAYFRELSRQPLEKPKPARAAPRRDLQGLLDAWGIAEGNRASPQLPGAPSSRREPLLVVALRELSVQAPERFAERSEELAYLSNVLLTGASYDGRRLRPLEAVELAVDCVSLGLRLACGEREPNAEKLAATLSTYPCDGLFRWALHEAAEKSSKGAPSDLRRVSAGLKELKI